MVITDNPLLAIELKATPNSNPTNNFNGGRNLVLSKFRNKTPPIGISSFTVQNLYSLTEKILNNQATLENGPGLALILITLYQFKSIFN